MDESGVLTFVCPGAVHPCSRSRGHGCRAAARVTTHGTSVLAGGRRRWLAHSGSPRLGGRTPRRSRMAVHYLIPPCRRPQDDQGVREEDLADLGRHGHPAEGVGMDSRHRGLLRRGCFTPGPSSPRCRSLPGRWTPARTAFSKPLSRFVSSPGVGSGMRAADLRYAADC